VREAEKSCRENQIARRHDAEPKADAKNPAAVRKTKLSRRDHEEEQKTKDEDTFAAHRLGDDGEEKPVPFATGHKQCRQGGNKRDAGNPAKGYRTQPSQAGKGIHSELKHLLDDQEDDDGARDVANPVSIEVQGVSRCVVNRDEAVDLQ
jgi:hypothetical protein